MAVRLRLPLPQLLRVQSVSVHCSRNAQVESAKPQPVYPPIVPSRTAKSKSAKRQRLLDFFERVRASDVQDKIRALTCIQRKKYVIYPQTFALNADKWYQHITKTAYIAGLPEKFIAIPQVNDESTPTEQQSSPVINESSFDEIRSLVCSAILQEHWYMKKRRAFLYKEQQHYVAPFLSNLASGLTNALAEHNPLLRSSNLDVEPQVNFYWMRGQRTIQRGHRSGRVEPIRCQIDDKPHRQIRVSKQLPEFVPLEADLSIEVPVVTNSLDVLPAFRRQYENNIFTGAKLNDPYKYGHTQFHLVPDRFCRQNMIKRQLEDQVEVFLRANGISSLFAWTGAQAMYQGFWYQEDLTRPFVSQAIITDGQYFSFFCYQLNTLALTSDHDDSNSRKNLCWGTESMRLYEGVADGEVVGLDDAVLRLLVQFLLNRP